MYNRLSSKTPLHGVLLSFVLLISACAPTAAEPGVVQPVQAATQVPAQAATEVPGSTQAPAASAASLEIWIAGLPQDQEELNKQIDGFQSANPGIQVVRKFTSYFNIDAELEAAGAAGVLPDIATLTLDSLAKWKHLEALAALDAGAFYDPAGFIPDAFNTGQIDGTQYGVPLQQFGCAPVYQYLSLFQTSKYPAEAIRLMDFLTRPQLLETSYSTIGRIPTRTQLYNALNLGCPADVVPIRLSQLELQTSSVKILAIAPSLQNVLLEQKGQVDAYQSIAIIEDGKFQGAMAAVLTAMSMEQAQQLQDGSGLDIAVVTIENAPEYPPGDYVMRCKSDGTCIFVRSDGSTLDIKLEKFETLDTAALTPVIVAEVGSKMACAYVFGKKYCIRIG